MTLRTRLAVIYAAIFSVLLGGLSAVSYRVLARQLDADATARLVELTDGLHGYLRFDHGASTIASDPNDPDQAAFIQEATQYYQIYNASTGSLVVQSDAIEPLGLQFTPAEVLAFRDQPKLHDIRTDYGRMRLSNSLVSAAGDLYLLQVAVSLNPVDRALNAFLDMLLWVVPISLVVAMLAGRWMVGLGLVPLVRLAAATHAIDVSNLQQRLPVRGAGDELDEVATAFNDTLARLERAVREMRQFSTALAHELRTPLAALRGEIELALLKRHPADEESRHLASQLEEIDRLKQMIAQLLTLARAEAGDIAVARTPVDLGALTASLVDQLEPVAQAKSIDLRLELGGTATVQGDGEWLERLVLNLVDNAIKFTPEGGRVSVAVRRDGEHAIVEVSDTGIGIAPDAQPHIFEPFFRGDPSRSAGAEGAGLGLSLVKWIVDRHNGRIQVQSSPGKGSTFTILLPLH
ncbi:MAG: heavy metal sensor histidine kinase [Vicinamibacterales bacterium]|nr:heavy metal sensor histidine kinase [Vicinamibacterales bacterium]